MTVIWKKWKHRLLENGLFWMALVLLSIGAGMVTYYKAAGEKAANSSVITGDSEETEAEEKKMQNHMVTFYP